VIAQVLLRRVLIAPAPPVTVALAQPHSLRSLARNRTATWLRSLPTLSVRSARCSAEGPGHSDFLDVCLTNALVEGTLAVHDLRRCGDTTDLDMLPSERREFGRTHRTCVFGYPRRNDGPAMSVVYYVPTDDDEAARLDHGGP
jgi:hypothetical protein